MFTKKITDSDAFIELSSSAQALYFHLNQGADDDGFNNQIQRAMFNAHATIDDLKVLMLKNFIIRFESGVIVIKHWRMHNTLRKDRYTPTNFQEELSMLNIKDNGAYTFEDSGCQMVAKWLPDGCHSIDKISIDKNSIDICQQIVDEYHTLCPSLPRVRQLTDKRRSQINSRLKKYSFDDFKEVFAKAEQSDFLKGSTGWKANFDFLINEGNMVKVLEGNYENRKKETKGNSFDNFEQREYGDDFERRLLNK